MESLKATVSNGNNTSQRPLLEEITDKLEILCNIADNNKSLTRENTENIREFLHRSVGIAEQYDVPQPSHPIDSEAKPLNHTIARINILIHTLGNIFDEQSRMISVQRNTIKDLNQLS